MPAYTSPRIRRLEADYKAMLDLKKDSTILDFETSGDPPDRYHIIFKGNGLVEKDGKVTIGRHHEADIRLGAEYPRQARIVELRFFGGYTEREIGQIIGVSVETVKRDWRFARAWLSHALQQTT